MDDSHDTVASPRFFPGWGVRQLLSRAVIALASLLAGNAAFVNLKKHKSYTDNRDERSAGSLPMHERSVAPRCGQNSQRVDANDRRTSQSRRWDAPKNDEMMYGLNQQPSRSNDRQEIPVGQRNSLECPERSGLGTTTTENHGGIEPKRSDHAVRASRAKPYSTVELESITPAAALMLEGVAFQ